MISCRNQNTRQVQKHCLNEAKVTNETVHNFDFIGHLLEKMNWKAVSFNILSQILKFHFVKFSIICNNNYKHISERTQQYLKTFTSCVRQLQQAELLINEQERKIWKYMRLALQLKDLLKEQHE